MHLRGRGHHEAPGDVGAGGGVEEETHGDWEFQFQFYLAVMLLFLAQWMAKRLLLILLFCTIVWPTIVLLMLPTDGQAYGPSSL